MVLVDIYCHIIIILAISYTIGSVYARDVISERCRGGGGDASLICRELQNVVRRKA